MDIVLLCLATKLLLRVLPPMLVHTLLPSDKALSHRMGAALSNCSVWGGAGFRPLSLEGERPLEHSTLV
jgi:hypothetical protein